MLHVLLNLKLDSEPLLALVQTQKQQYAGFLSIFSDNCRFVMGIRHSSLYCHVPRAQHACISLAGPPQG